MNRFSGGSSPPDLSRRPVLRPGEILRLRGPTDAEADEVEEPPAAPPGMTLRAAGRGGLSFWASWILHFGGNGAIVPGIFRVRLWRLGE